MDKREGDVNPREIGVVMPFRALPGDHDHQGTFGPESVEFLTTMERAGFSVLQDLPINPPDPFESPYSSSSAFAIDPQRIDLFQLAELGDIDRFSLDRYQKLVVSGDAGPAIKGEKQALLRQAHRGFTKNASPERHAAFDQWREDEAGWVDSFAAFEILKQLPENHDWRWQNWEIGREHSKELVSEIRRTHEEEFSAICYEQWTAHEQTKRYLKEADSLGVKVWGDVPFYVGGSEVWANRELFNLDSEGYQLNQGGAAPSQTSATGQLWGFATYKVEEADPGQTAKVVDWWAQRLERAKELNSGLVRLDHFIGFAEPYIIAADAEHGMDGYRDTGLGYPLFTKLRGTYGSTLPFYPEDLGTQTQKTPELRDSFGFAANTLAVRGLTKCLLLGEYDKSIHNPDNYRENSVNISSNHDSPPLVEALDMVRSEHPEEFMRYVNYINEQLPYEELPASTSSERLAQIEMERVTRSVGRYAIMGIWDILQLGSEGRYNVPNTISQNNWSWRMDSRDMAQLRSQEQYWRELSQSAARTATSTFLEAAAD